MNWLQIARKLVAAAIFIAAIAVGIWTNDWRWGTFVLILGLAGAFGLGRVGF